MQIKLITLVVSCLCCLTSCASSGDDEPVSGGTGDEQWYSVSMGVTSELARSCDVELELNGPPSYVDVRFGDGLRGTYQKQHPRLTISFTALNDTSISGVAAEVNIRGSAAALGAESLQLKRAQCFGEIGRALDGAGVAFR
jgi:hypothetical protein